MGNKLFSDRTREMKSRDNSNASSSRQTTEFLRTLQSAEASTTKESDIPLNIRRKRKELNSIRNEAIQLLEFGKLDDNKRELMKSKFKVFEKTFRDMKHWSALPEENEDLWPKEYENLGKDKDKIKNELVERGILDKQ